MDDKEFNMYCDFMEERRLLKRLVELDRARYGHMLARIAEIKRIVNARYGQG